MEQILYKFEYPKFDDKPLDVLLNIIEKDNMEITNLPIANLTEQFLKYIENMKEDRMEVISSFLVVASELLRIKSRILLPNEKNDEDINEEDRIENLINQLLERRKNRDLADRLSDYEEEAPEYMLKDATIPQDVKAYIPEINYDELLDGIDTKRLTDVFNDVLRRKRDSVDTIRAGFGILRKEKVPLKDTIIEVAKYANVNKSFSFRKMLEEKKSKTLVIVSFLAILELIKVGRLKVRQDNSFDDIYIEVVEGAKGIVDFKSLEDV